MTDETVTPEETPAPALSVVPDAKMFDLKAALAGRTYPTKDVPVFLDEALAWGLQKANLAADQNPSSAELEAERNALAKQFADQAMTFHLQAVPRHVRVAVEQAVDKVHPPQLNMLGYEMPDDIRADAVTEAMWNVYVNRISGPDGSVVFPTPEDISEFRRMAPSASVDAVTAGIKSLIQDSEKGYELGVQELSFLSQPSQEG